MSMDNPEQPIKFDSNSIHIQDAQHQLHLQQEEFELKVAKCELKQQKHELYIKEIELEKKYFHYEQLLFRDRLQSILTHHHHHHKGNNSGLPVIPMRSDQLSIQTRDSVGIELDTPHCSPNFFAFVDDSPSRYLYSKYLHSNTTPTNTTTTTTTTTTNNNTHNNNNNYNDNNDNNNNNDINTNVDDMVSLLIKKDQQLQLEREHFDIQVANFTAQVGEFEQKVAQFQQNVIDLNKRQATLDRYAVNIEEEVNRRLVNAIGTGTNVTKVTSAHIVPTPGTKAAKKLEQALYDDLCRNELGWLKHNKYFLGLEIINLKKTVAVPHNVNERLLDVLWSSNETKLSTLLPADAEKIPNLDNKVKIFISSVDVLDGEWVQIYGNGTILPLTPAICTKSLCNRITKTKQTSINVANSIPQGNTLSVVIQMKIKWEIQ